MDALLEKMIKNLEAQQALYQRLLHTLQDENDAVIAADINGVDAAIHAKEDILCRIESIEQERNEITRVISGEMGIGPDEITLSRLSDTAGEYIGSRLSKLKTDLSGLISNISEKNDLNRKLLNHCIGLVKGSLSLINGVVAPSPVYYKSGKMTGSSKSGMVLSGSI